MGIEDRFWKTGDFDLIVREVFYSAIVFDEEVRGRTKNIDVRSDDILWHLSSKAPAGPCHKKDTNPTGKRLFANSGSEPALTVYRQR